MAQYMVSWVARPGGSAAESEVAAKRGLQLFSKWSPHPSATFKVFVGRLDARGGYALVETDDPAALAEGPAKFGTAFDFEIVPVMDIMDGVGILSEGIEFRDSIS